MSYRYLEVLRGIETGRRYALGEGAVSVGRSSANSIALHPAEKSVSGHHAIIYSSADHILIQDLQSTNGTFVNEEQIREKDLAPGDIIGFGKAGARVKYIQSDTELPLTQAAVPVSSPTVSTTSKTIDDDSGLRRHRDLQARSADASPGPGNTARVPHIRPGTIDPFSAAAIEGGGTMAVERRLMEKNISAADMHSLIKDGKRLEKIVQRGQLGTTQVNLLVSVHQAASRMRRQNLIILAVVSIVALGLVAYFAGRAWQYRQMVNHSLTLEQKLDGYEQRIAKLKKDPRANKGLLAGLIDTLEENQQKLSAIRGNLNENDQRRLYASELEETIVGIMARFGETAYRIPPEMMQRVKHHLDVYSSPRMRPLITRYIKRKEMYLPMIRTALKENNLPFELAYVAMLESGYNNNALSHAGARGMWQFMPATARNFGLTVNDEVDDRLDPHKSTYAAAEYFKDLIAIFGGKSSVMLAMAAYNAGEGRVIRALRKIDDPVRNRDFWYIYRMGFLAEETNEYIPRILAFMILSENPQKYGFDPSVPVDIPNLEAANDFVEVTFSSDTAGEQ